MKRNVSLFYAHPNHAGSRVNRAMFERASKIPGIQCFDLYERYPDFHIDVTVEQAILLKSDAVILQHPFHWYSCPPLMKHWIDAVLEHGFAYGPGGDKLTGKIWGQAISVGGAPSAYQRDGYNHFTVYEFLRPFEQTAYLCAMSLLRPYLLEGATGVQEEDLQRHVDGYEKFLMKLRDGEDLPRYDTLALGVR